MTDLQNQVIFTSAMENLRLETDVGEDPKDELFKEYNHYA